MTTPKISIIVPAYKTEDYLRKCVDGILSQTFRDFELLLIDDGSPDLCGEICDEYAKKDERVKAFHKPNGGLASARQFGIDRIQGEYVIHADSDDWIEQDMLQSLYDEARKKDADIVICDYFRNIGDKQSIINVSPSTDNIELIVQMLHGEVHSSLCNKLVKSNLYKENYIRWIDGLNYGEDFSVMFRLVFFAENISYLPCAFYHYWSNPASMVTTNTFRMVDAFQLNVCDLIKLMVSFFNEQGVEQKELKSAILYYKVREYCNIALNGNLSLYKKSIDIWDDINIQDIEKFPLPKHYRMAGILLKKDNILILKLLRLVSSSCRYVKYKILQNKVIASTK